MDNINDYLKNIIQNIPDKPGGCYEYFDEKGVIIYVGKAKNLKNAFLLIFPKLIMTARKHGYS